MEKIIPHQKKDAIIFISVITPIALVLYFYGIKQEAIIGAIFTIALIFILKVIYDFLYHSRISIGEEGILLNWYLHKRMIPWSDVAIETKALNKDQKNFIFLNKKEKLITLKIDYLNNCSLINLTKKYCPKNHDLYKIVEEYAKERSRPF